jgi:hypothetical protein
MSHVDSPKLIRRTNARHHRQIASNREELMNRNHRASLIALTFAVAVYFTLASAAAPQSAHNPSNATQAFEKLKSLTGRWEATTEKGNAATTFQVVSGGSAVLESAKMPGEAEMVTVYHLDSNRLLLTHYCMVGNQPRMQATDFDPKSNSIDFHFLDATNLPDANAGHMHSVVIRFQGPSEISESWTFYKDGKAAFTEPIQFHRAN